MVQKNSDKLKKDRPNVIICMCDQLRAFEVHCYGNEIIQTPNIDRLANEGARFEIGITNNPLCMPARSIILTGQYSRTCCGQLYNSYALVPGGDKWILPEYPTRGRPHLRDPTLPETLRNNGYSTAAIGKWHIESWPHDVGFDYYLIPRVYHVHVGQKYTENGGPEFIPEGFTVDFEAEKVGEFLQTNKDSEKPFFLYYNISPPHLPYWDIPERYKSMYNPEDMPIRENAIINGEMAYDRRVFKSYVYDRKYYDFGLPFTEELRDDFDLRHLYALYYGSTSWVDDTIGKLLDNLEKTGLKDNTIVVFTSDHGDALGSHSRWQKTLFYQEITRIPLVWRVPGITDGKVITQQVGSLIDTMPTILDFIGIDVPEHIQGQSLASIIRGETKTLDKNYTFIESMFHGAAIRTLTHIFGKRLDSERKLTETRNKFYDLERDPFEYVNLANSDQQRDLRKELEILLERWNAETKWLGSD
ncbi:MAG: sulfatase family protein [Candidatus Hodarchaeales archaeon]|jgi:choline-sulfatase